jgi:hypothetical protein
MKFVDNSQQKHATLSNLSPQLATIGPYTPFHSLIHYVHIITVVVSVSIGVPYGVIVVIGVSVGVVAAVADGVVGDIVGVVDLILLYISTYKYIPYI